MKDKKKSNKKAFLIFGIVLIVYMIFMSVIGDNSEPSSDLDEIETYEQQEIDLQNLEKFSFGESLETVLLEIGVDDATEAVCEVDNAYGMTLRVTTSTKRLWVSIDDYFQDKREVNWIKDYDSGDTIYYYISDDLHYNEPIYSYKTGEVLVDKVDGESEKYPLVITVEQLVNEINKDIQVAADKYNGKWVQITGKVTHISDGGDMYGYYLYGEKGNSGLKITCWVTETKKSTSVGQTKTFLGVMQEVTTVNNTEITKCTIVE